ncbi:GNAT family N-acetyltransferase [Comamonas testosteroni]|uniref:GNAT family N-acetyltransferase n=1 Tax=Comamonas testosteroni TaxID=285 RepID=UPI0009B62631|nr:N-acetyltransferase [Comamonas testosteroni]QQN71614.1 GNAT family N-acetyltransferase [Comamonas testosteroni]
MRIPESVLALIENEQKSQNGLFVPGDSEYFEKLARHAELIIHQDSSGVLGYVFFYCNAVDKKASYITLIGTSAQSRGKGVGYGLLQHVLNISKQRGFSCCQLEVRKENTRAFDFYRQIGFAVEEDRGEKYLMSIATR